VDSAKLLLLLLVVLVAAVGVVLVLVDVIVAFTCWASEMMSSKSSASGPLAFLGFPGIACTASAVGKRK
jgi:hypothetical protein